MTLHFHDASNNNPNYQPTGPTIFKATEGADFVDVEFTRVRAQTLAGGWPFLPYHFLRTGDIPAQVQHAQAVAGVGPLMLDVEVAEDDGTWPSVADAAQFIALHGRVTLGYIPEWFWREHWGSPNLVGLLAGAGLISSVYAAYSDTGPGWVPYGGVTPVIWQWTSTPLDTNAFKGTEAELARIFQEGNPMTSPTTAQQVDDIAWVLDAVAHLRPTVAGGRYQGAAVELGPVLLDIQKRLAALESAGAGGAPVNYQLPATVLTPVPPTLPAGG